MTKEVERFEQWWDAEDDIPNNGPYTPDTPIQFAWAAWQAALAEQPAQQEPKIDIYRSFEQWKSGNVLEHGVPRTEHYSEAQLDLVEMGWNYGYDAGRAVEQALDKKAENARELGLDYEPAQQEPVAWMTEERYAEMHTSKWTPKIQQVFSKDGILESQTIQYAPQSKTVPYPLAQRTWLGLTDEEAVQTWEGVIKYAPGDVRIKDFARAIEAKLKEKNA